MDEELEALWSEKLDEAWRDLMLEGWIRDRAPVWFWPLLRQARVIPSEQLADRTETAWEVGRITEEELFDALRIALVVEGLHRRERRRILLGVEVARQGKAHHVHRAFPCRAKLLARAFEEEVWPMVASEALDPAAQEAARRLGVRWARVEEDRGEKRIRFFAPEKIPAP
ncbi:hypothetical protein [Thermoflexus sp.]|uniref:hypothetical protein n=1 Tax=Thermoflexus sp. TaxID=1969742 RepID=UPI0035E4061B